MSKKPFNAEWLREEVLDANIFGSDTVEVVKDDIIDTSRWSIHHEIVFKYEDKYYRTTYSVGATESQDEIPWEYEDEVECEVVEPVEKTYIDYEVIK